MAQMFQLTWIYTVRPCHRGIYPFHDHNLFKKADSDLLEDSRNLFKRIKKLLFQKLALVCRRKSIDFYFFSLKSHALVAI
jgi:hypothetical protein